MDWMGNISKQLTNSQMLGDYEKGRLAYLNSFGWNKPSSGSGSGGDFISNSFGGSGGGSSEMPAAPNISYNYTMSNPSGSGTGYGGNTYNNSYNYTMPSMPSMTMPSNTYNINTGGGGSGGSGSPFDLSSLIGMFAPQPSQGGQTQQQQSSILNSNQQQSALNNSILSNPIYTKPPDSSTGAVAPTWNYSQSSLNNPMWFAQSTLGPNY